MNVDPKKFPFYKEKDGFKIKFENRNLNVSDFLTKGLHLKWNEAKTTLFNAYQLQLENRLTKESENAIIFKPTIGQSDHYTVQDSINVFRYLVQKQELRDQTMGAIDKLRELADQANEIKPNFDAQSFKDLFKTQQQKQQQELHDKVYTIADLVPTKNLQKKEVTYKRADTGKDVMVDRGDRIRFMSKTPSDSDVLAGITMAAEKFGSIQLKGTDEFKKQVLEQAAKADLTVVFMPKELHEEFNLMKEELKSKNAIVDGDAMEQKDHNAIVNSGTNKEQQTDAQTNVQETAQNAPESTQESPEQQANTNAQANANVEPEHAQEQQTQDSKVQFYEEIQKRVNSAETPQELESLRNELENDDRYRVMGDSYEELTNGETKLDPVIDKMIANKGEAIESEIAQEATQEVKLTTAPDELPKGLYRVNYVKDDQTNTLSVRVNGKAIGEAVPDRFIENLRTQSQFLSNFSTDEIKQGGLSYDRITDGSTATSISADETGMKFGSNSESQSNQNTNSDTQTHRRFV
ncbi:hypothetical protein BWP24_28085 (plasmid) [Vibrio campbellii]|nr:hypothetical protein BWP24_28085 [Vibrio campbellii]